MSEGCQTIPEDALTKQIMDADVHPMSYCGAGRTTLLDKARATIFGPRQSDYGPALENHARIAAVWSMVLGIPVTPEQVVMCMVGVKLARLAHTPNHEDSWLDIAGYAGVWDKMRNGE